MEECNREHAPGYGDDEWTRRASDALREVFRAIVRYSLCSMGQQRIPSLCHAVHITVSCATGWPIWKRMSAQNGSKVLLLDGEQGKICPASIEEAVMRRTDLQQQGGECSSRPRWEQATTLRTSVDREPKTGFEISYGCTLCQCGGGERTGSFGNDY